MIFLLKNTDCGNTLEQPRIKNSEKYVYPCKPQTPVLLFKGVVQGVNHCTVQRNASCFYIVSTSCESYALWLDENMSLCIHNPNDSKLVC